MVRASGREGSPADAGGDTPTLSNLWDESLDTDHEVHREELEGILSPVVVCGTRSSAGGMCPQIRLL